jgi:hypothetical protein
VTEMKHFNDMQDDEHSSKYSFKINETQKLDQKALNKIKKEQDQAINYNIF